MKIFLDSYCYLYSLNKADKISQENESEKKKWLPSPFHSLSLLLIPLFSRHIVFYQLS